MEPHQQRVVAEKSELDEKSKKLGEFIELSPIFSGLSDDEKERLVRQKSCMGEYSEIRARCANRSRL
jgi:hypothetical protein